MHFFFYLVRIIHGTAGCDGRGELFGFSKLDLQRKLRCELGRDHSIRTYGGVGRRGWCRRLRVLRGLFPRGQRRAGMLHDCWTKVSVRLSEADAERE